MIGKSWLHEQEAADNAAYAFGWWRSMGAGTQFFCSAQDLSQWDAVIHIQGGSCLFS